MASEVRNEDVEQFRKCLWELAAEQPLTTQEAVDLGTEGYGWCYSEAAKQVRLMLLRGELQFDRQMLLAAVKRR